MVDWLGKTQTSIKCSCLIAHLRKFVLWRTKFANWLLHDFLQYTFSSHTLINHSISSGAVGMTITACIVLVTLLKGGERLLQTYFSRYLHWCRHLQRHFLHHFWNPCMELYCNICVKFYCIILFWSYIWCDAGIKTNYVHSINICNCASEFPTVYLIFSTGGNCLPYCAKAFLYTWVLIDWIID